ncbi:phosphoglycerate kinase [Filifactor alocis]|uniref:phosphoglycerate kinase n=1 Tax=Filifactor alocis TaxID=143361 RepID=UPI003F9FA09A
MLNKKRVYDLEVADKKVLVRCDFNVPMKDGAITDDRRIISALETITYLTEHDAKVILMSHLGRPDKKYDRTFSMKPIAKRLSELLKKEVPLAEDENVVGEHAKELVSNMKKGDVILLENVRFVKGETKNDLEFAKALASLADLYVNDAFGTAHRAHSSTAGVAQFLPSAMGFLIEKEVSVMGKALVNPDRPFVAILGGSKVSDKISVIENLLDKVDTLVIGGAMAFTFAKAIGTKVGISKVEEDKVEVAASLLERAKEKGVRLILPLDYHVTTEFSDATESFITDDANIPDGYMGLDIGDKTIQEFEAVLKNAKTVVWNGPMGVFEINKYAVGTKAVAEILSHLDAVTIVGGGDSAAAVEKLGYADSITHISTGGGASLEFLEGKVLPGIDAISDR